MNRRSMLRLLVLLSAIATTRAGFAADPVRGWIPSTLLRQGQVGLAVAADRVAVDVLLHTRYLDRAVRSIADKERRNWPPDHPDALNYAEALASARRAVAGEGRETLHIAFRIAPAPGAVEWSTGRVVTEADGSWRLDDVRVIAVTDVSRAYLLRNAALILEDSLGLSAERIIAALAPHTHEEEQGWIRGVPDE